MKILPTRTELMNPTIEALKQLGGSANTDEIYEKIVEILGLSDSILNKVNNGKTGQSVLKYNLAWVRTMLKNQEVLINVGKGIWVLKNYNTEIKIRNDSNYSEIEEEQVSAEVEYEENWKNNVINIITKKLSPSAFERLIQRILREKGFSQVEITGKSGDGGIDGKGIAKINGILSFHIVFQCKRYKGKVPASDIRDFRGSMVGRTDKGLFITTGTFTRDAIKEANRDGAPSIDLMDGEKLAEKLKELNLGINTELKEHITINENWFENF